MEHFESQYPADAQMVEIEKVISFLKSGASCQLLGLPGAGKSVLLRLLTYNRKVRELHLGEAQKQFHFVYMDFAEVKNRSLTDVTKFILISLSYSLNEREMTEEHTVVNNILQEAVKFQDELILFQALKRSIDYLAVENGLTVVFLFDRFDHYVQNVTEQFFSNLKILRNRAKFKFSAVFSLSRPFDSLVESSVLTDFYEFLVGNTVFFNIEQKVEHTFRLLYIENLVQNKNDKAKEMLITITGDHGKLLKTGYEAVLANDEQFKKEFTQDQLTGYLLAHRQMKGVLTELVTYLTPHERMLINNLTPQHLETEEIKFLIHIGLIKNGSLSIPLLEKFMSTRAEEDTESFLYDETRNEIMKGSVSITDQLTPSEFRLFRYLIVNKGKVCEKEDIINAVWKDTKTQEGVTDQALDQIIYRLRKKVEIDPNNPTHIQTVKGRGIKLSE